MNNSKIAILIVFLISIVTSAFAHNTPVPKLSEIKRQHPKDILIQANNHYTHKAYNKAYYYYLALRQLKKRVNVENTYRLGKTALYAKEFKMAKKYLALILDKGSKYSLVTFEYGKALKHLGDYSNAITYFKKYRTAHQGERYNDYLGIAKRHIAACEKALESKEYSMDIEIESLGENFEELGGSVRSLTVESKYGTRLVEYQDDRGTCIKKVMADNSIELLTSSAGNPIFNNKSPYIAPDGESVYFTREELSTTGEVEYKIYTGNITKNGDVDKIRKLGSGVNRIGCSSLYPTLSTTEHGQEILYFASTQPGGYGGYDIWYSVRMTNREFTKAYNLGVRVNSTDDEITPFYYQEDQELYFSSNKPDGFGGFDVYKMAGEKKLWDGKKATHLSDPVNSHGDDMHYTKDKKGNGSFSTNRTGGKDKTVKFKKKIPAA
ncbi:MAG: hypothetical protein GY810_09065 [Aureispira sp.]|nr:hypothetical protein [Aureispira sp.]